MFCALCTADIVGKPIMQPFGKNDALVAICEPCDVEHPSSGRYSFNGSESPSRAAQHGQHKTGRPKGRA